VSEPRDVTGEEQRNVWFWPVFGGTISYTAALSAAIVRRRRRRRPSSPPPPIFTAAAIRLPAL